MSRAGALVRRRPLAVSATALVVVVVIGAVLLVSAMVTRAATPQGHAAPGFGIAASPGTLEDMTPGELDAYFAEYRATGMTWLRALPSWSDLQRVPGGPYDWSAWDRILGAARAHGVQVIEWMGGVPAWARSSACTGTGGWEEACPPLRDVPGYAAVNAAMAARYPGLVVEVWNEPNKPAFWSPAPDPAQYTALLVATSDAVKRVSPTTTVLTAGLAPKLAATGGEIAPVSFLRAVYEHGGQGHFDGVAWHPYLWHDDTTPRPLPGQTVASSAWFEMSGTSPSARSLMTAHGDGDKRIWITEFGTNTSGGGMLSATEAEQAAIYARAVRVWREYPWAGPFCFYTDADYSRYGESGDGERFFGLWRRDHSPKPAVDAVRGAVGEG